MPRWLLVLLFLVALPASAGMLGQSRSPNYNNTSLSGSTYTGPGDVVSGATGWYGLRAYSSSQVGGTTKAVSIRRASDNTTCDFDINTSGDLGGTDAGCGTGTGLSLAAFATTDATATCTIATTTATCVSGSSVPHANSTITGSGVTQPCFASAAGVGTAPSFTIALAGSGAASPCGTIGVGVILTFTYGLFATEVYDQTGNGLHVLQATAGTQPQLLPTCLNSLSCLNGPTGGGKNLSATIASTANASYTAVAQRNFNFTTQQSMFTKTGVQSFLGFTTSANTTSLGSTTTLGSVVDQSPHAIQGVYGATSSVCADGTCGTGTQAAPAAGTGIAIMAFLNGTASLQGFWSEAGVWASNFFSSTQITNMCHNQRLYWGTPGSC